MEESRLVVAHSVASQSKGNVLVFGGIVKPSMSSLLGIAGLSTMASLCCLSTPQCLVGSPLPSRQSVSRSPTGTLARSFSTTFGGVSHFDWFPAKLCTDVPLHQPLAYDLPCKLSLPTTYTLQLCDGCDED